MNCSFLLFLIDGKPSGPDRQPSGGGGKKGGKKDWKSRLQQVLAVDVILYYICVVI